MLSRSEEQASYLNIYLLKHQTTIEICISIYMFYIHYTCHLNVATFLCLFTCFCSIFDKAFILFYIDSINLKASDGRKMMKKTLKYINIFRGNIVVVAVADVISQFQSTILMLQKSCIRIERLRQPRQ